MKRLLLFLLLVARLSILLLLLLLVTKSVNATPVTSGNGSIDNNIASTLVFDTVSDDSKGALLDMLPVSTQNIPQANSTPPTTWIIGLGIFLIFIGYQMKRNSH